MCLNGLHTGESKENPEPLSLKRPYVPGGGECVKKKYLQYTKRGTNMIFEIPEDGGDPA